MTIASTRQGRKSNLLGMLVSLVVALAFLWFAFRGVSLGEVWSVIREVSWWDTAALLVLGLTGVILRAWRWWYTLPRPHRSGEFSASFRALAMGYAANNAVPRLGEAIRVMVLARRSERDVAQIISTVVIDRFLLDLLALAALFAMGMLIARDDLVLLLGDRMAAVNLLLVIAIAGTLGMLLFAVAPQAFKSVLEALGARRLGRFWLKIATLIDQLSQGMAIMKEPRRYFWILLQTVLIWASYIAMFGYALHLFDIHVETGTMLVIYSITVLGIALPSPGGVGTFHFFARLGLTELAGADMLQATSVATYAHGINFLGLTLFGLLAFVWEALLAKQPTDRDKLQITKEEP